MSKKENLLHVIEDYKSRRNTAELIEVHWADGRKAGIGNPVAIQKVIDCIIEEAERQFLVLEASKIPYYDPTTDEQNGKRGWKQYPDEKPALSGEYLVRGIGGLDNKLHHWVCLWVGECDDKTLAHRFFYGGNEFQNVPSGRFEWMDPKEL